MLATLASMSLSDKGFMEASVFKYYYIVSIKPLFGSTKYQPNLKAINVMQWKYGKAKDREPSINLRHLSSWHYDVLRQCH